MVRGCVGGVFFALHVWVEYVATLSAYGSVYGMDGGADAEFPFFMGGSYLGVPVFSVARVVLYGCVLE